MKYLFTVVLLLAITLFRYQYVQSENFQVEPLSNIALSTQNGSSIVAVAPGRIEGKSEAVELNFQVSERVIQITVRAGDRVAAGDVIAILDSSKQECDYDLAKAQLDLALAKKQRIINGARPSEIEAARQELAAKQPLLWGAKRQLDRSIKLFEKKAISRQTLDDAQARYDAIAAESAIAKARLATLTLPARKDDLGAAQASINMAKATLAAAKIQIQHCVLKAPSDCQVVEVNRQIGELSQTNLEPAFVVVDNSELFAIAEVDEFDSLKIKLGQLCDITCNAETGTIATGQVVEIEPAMQRKKIFGQWAGERLSTYSRRVRVKLESSIQLPIALPIEVHISHTSTLPLDHDYP